MNLVGFTLALITLLCLPLHAQTKYSSYHKRIIAAQVFHSYAPTLAEFEEQIIEMKRQGVNTVIFRVFGNKGDRIYAFSKPLSPEGVYFKTTQAPLIDDILGEVISIIHRNDMKIFAWMTTRYVLWGMEERLLENEFDLSSNKQIKTNKLDLFNTKSVRILERIYSDLARYPIDGVLFQDDFIIKHMDGFGPSAKLAYISTFKRFLNPSAMYSNLIFNPDRSVKRIEYTAEFWKWAKWKNKRLKYVADRLIKSVKSQNPHIQTCINTTYELYRNPRNTLAWQSHTIGLMNKFDLISVMAYHRQLIDELGVSRSSAANTIKLVALEAIKIHGAEKVIIKTQAKDWQNAEMIPNNEIQFFYNTINSISDEVGMAIAPWEGDIKLDLKGKGGY